MNGSIAHKSVQPEKRWYDTSDSGPTAGGRGTLGGSPRLQPEASRTVPNTESKSGTEGRLTARPATRKKVQARIVRKASGGVLRATDASVKRSPRARRP